MNLDDTRAAVAAEYPDENWDTLCAGFAYLVCRLAGTVRRGYASATDARNASEIVSTDINAAPAGAFHHWSYPAVIGGVYKDWGHVALALGGGRAVMTNPERDEWDWGVCLGETDVASWTARRRGVVTYLGWSYTYGVNTATITTESAASVTARAFETESEEDDMKIISNGQGAQKFADELGADDIGEFFFVPNGPDQAPTWVDNIHAAWKLAGEPVDAPGWEYDLARHIADARWTRKRGQIVADVVASLKPLLAELAASIAGISPDRFAELIEKGLADVVITPAPISDTDRAAIAKAVVDEQAKRLAK